MTLMVISEAFSEDFESFFVKYLIFQVFEAH